MAFTIDELPIILSEFCPDGTGVPAGQNVTGTIHITKSPSGNFNAFAFSSGGSSICELTTSTGVLLEKYNGSGDQAHGGIKECVEGTYINYLSKYITPNGVYLRISYPDKRLYALWDSPDWVSNPATINYFEKPVANEEWNYGCGAPQGDQYVLLQFFDSTVSNVSPGLEWLKVGTSAYAVKLPEIGEDKITSWKLTLNPINKYAFTPQPSTVTLRRMKLWLEEYTIAIEQGINRVTLKPDIRWGIIATTYLIKLEPVDTEKNYITSQQLSNDGKDWNLILSPNNGPDRVSKYKIKYGAWEDPEIITIIQKGSIQYNFSVTPNNLNVGSNGGNLSSTISTNYTTFTNSIVPEWVTLFRYIPNQSGIIDIQVLPNPSTEKRVATIQFKDGTTILDTLNIVQEGIDLYFSVEPSEIRSPNTGGSYTLTVKTNMQYSMKDFDNTTESGTAWYNINQSPVNSIREIVYNIKVKPNMAARQYTGYVMFYPTGKSPVKVPITLGAAEPILKYSPTANDIPVDTTTLTVYRYHNLPYISESETLNGVTYTKEIITPYPNGVTKYNINVSKNTSATDRVSYLQSLGNSPGLEQITTRYTLTQRSGLLFDIQNNIGTSIRDIHFTNERGTYNAQALYNVTWTLTNASQLPSWLKLVGITQDLNSDKLTQAYVAVQNYTAEVNTGEEREFIAIYNSQRAGTIQVRIVQEGGIVPAIKVDPNFKEFDNGPNEFHITVSATHSWSASNIPDWITLAPIHGVADITIVKVTIKPNILFQRFATLVFKLDDYNLSDICRIDQLGLENGYDITDVGDDSDWGARQEARIRDKYVKVKIRYTGNDKAIITAVKTLYTTSYA